MKIFIKSSYPTTEFMIILIYIPMKESFSKPKDSHLQKLQKEISDLKRLLESTDNLQTYMSEQPSRRQNLKPAPSTDVFDEIQVECTNFTLRVDRRRKEGSQTRIEFQRLK